MPKRIVDGEALWTSSKLAKIKPERFRVEYAWILPLALANGVLEADPHLIWSKAYAFNRPDVSRNDVEKILATFESVGLLFRWADTNGKAWAYFIGSDKRGRLPARSLRDRYGCGPQPPKDKLAEYLQRVGSPQPEALKCSEKEVGEKKRRSMAKTPLPEGFCITDGLREWATSKGYSQLEAHLEHFVETARARGYLYADWTAAFQRAVRENWARVPAPQISGPSAVERARKQLEQ